MKKSLHMTRVFAYIGSPHGKNSNTYAVTTLFCNALARRDPSIQFSLFTPADTTIQYCQGCWSCMKKGVCPQDESDDMYMIKEAMLDSDLIILGSPVYCLNVSGQTKTFLDRLPSWLHRFPLAGRMGVSVVTTGGAGLEEVHRYLGMMMMTLGLKKMGELGAAGNLPGVLYDERKALDDAEQLADVVYPYLSGRKELVPDEIQEGAFSFMKSIFTNPDITIMEADSCYWEESGMSSCGTFSEYVEKLRRQGKAG
jgi:multimeric flavodoxin WrbA